MVTLFFFPQEDRSGCRCFLIGESEAVMRSTADLVCAGHSGSWVAELDHPGLMMSVIPDNRRSSFFNLFFSILEHLGCMIIGLIQ